MTKSNETSRKDPMTRRAMLAKLGLAAAAIYVAPVALELNQARASSFSGRGGGGRRRSYSGRGGGDRRRRSYS